MKNNIIKEAQVYELDYRLTCNNIKTIKLYGNKNVIDVSQQISFDSNYDKSTSIDLFASALSSDILISIINYFKAHDMFIDELEARMKISLSNPLSFLNVKGYDKLPTIDEIKLKIYIYVNSENLDEDLKKALKNAFLYNTFKQSLNIFIDIEELL